MASVLVPDPKLVVLRFNEAINARDLEGLVALMSEEHRFVDDAGQSIQGRAPAREAWRSFFATFPDYRNHFSSLESLDHAVIVLGHSTCSDPGLSGPAIWTAYVRAGVVAEWRVHEDTEETRKALFLRAGDLFVSP